MNPIQSDVQAFHLALDIPVGDTPGLRRTRLRAELIMEEAVETVESMTGWELRWSYRGKADPQPQDGNLIQTIDGLCDLLCVTFGAAVEFGVDLDPFWDEVHRTNMAKQGGPTRADGKKLKPEGWTPPDIEGILKRVRGDQR